MIYVYYLSKMQKLLTEIQWTPFYATCKKRGSIELIGTIDDVINKIADDETMRQLWNNYRKTNYYVGALEWEEVIGSARKLRIMIE